MKTLTVATNMENRPNKKIKLSRTNHLTRTKPMEVTMAKNLAITKAMEEHLATNMTKTTTSFQVE